MNRDERQFEDFISKIKFDDEPDAGHRDNLEKKLLAVLLRQPRHKQRHLKIWRIIMKSRIAKLSAAAAVLIIIVTVSWLSSEPGSTQRISSFTLLARTSAAEQRLFYGTGGITHIANEIILYPGRQRDVSELLNELESDTTQDRNISFVKGWLSYRWIPVYSVGPDGQTREHKLELSVFTDKAVTVSDLSWYDAATGRFARVLKTGDQVLFANSYDGQNVYTMGKGPGGTLQMNRETVTAEFKVPDNPADFLGIAAGLRGAIPREYYPPIQDVTTEILENGTSIRTYKLGFTDPWGKVESYFLFKVSTDADVIDQIECVVEGKPTRIHRRIMAETVDKPALSWDLTELISGETTTSIAVEASKASSIVTIRQMVERATGPVYVFAAEPSWTHDQKIYDLPDETSPPARSFAATYRGRDGRDIVLTQGESFNRYFSAVFGKVQEMGEQVPWTFESENGFKILHQNDKETEMWWTEFALKSSGFEPTANRVGYILMSPAKTFLVLAINGPVSEQELHGLLDSLVPADQYGQ